MLNNFFAPKSVAIIGASRSQEKIGHVIIRNLIDGKYSGKVYPINPNADEILGLKSYSSVKKVKGIIDLAVICIPRELVLKALDECKSKNIKNVIIPTSGFKEVGNKKLDEMLEKKLKKHKITAIGPNCLGTYDSYSGLDTIFNPRYKMSRPSKGGISFVVQSGAIGCAIMDMAESNGLGISKFISYGNAMIVNETDILEYMKNDKSTKVVCMYVEGIKDGKKFMKVAKEISKKKPVIILKGGVTNEGSKAAISHSGSLTSSIDAYFAAFKQCNLITAETLEEMFNYARIMNNSIKPKGGKVQIITNGGGFGILSTDQIIKNGLKMAKIDKKTISMLKKIYTPNVVVSNPIDLVGNATSKMYRSSIEACINDNNVDIILVIALYQTPALNPDVVDVITEFKDLKKKPIIVVSLGGEFTEVLTTNLKNSGVPVYNYPSNAVKSIKKLVKYYEKR